MIKISIILIKINKTKKKKKKTTKNKKQIIKMQFSSLFLDITKATNF